MKEPGKMAYEAWMKAYGGESLPWEDLGDDERDEWAAVESAIRTDEAAKLRAENERLREALTPKVDDTLEELANRLWSVHPKTVQDSGLTRRQWYAREIENYFVIARAALEEKK